MRLSIGTASLLGAAYSSAQLLLQQQPLGAIQEETFAFRTPPPIGFGTWRLTESFENTSAAVEHAIVSGYRHIDCAAAYGNQKAVGDGIAKGMEKIGLNRQELWITSKLWNDHHDPTKVKEGLDTTLKDLGLHYLDEYLMHWPVGKTGKDGKLREDYLATWKAMEVLRFAGQIRFIGVSNFSPLQLAELIEKSSIKPAIHQMELHPYLQQTGWLQWHEIQGIHVTAYSPLGNMNPVYGERNVGTAEDPPVLLEDEVLGQIAKESGCTIPQVALAWGVSRGTSVIPKSKHPKWIEENLGSLQCVLSAHDYETINKRGLVKRFNNPSNSWGVKLFEGLDDA